MKIAIPTAEGKLARHFGHVREFTFVLVDDGKINGTETDVPPPHEPGVLPKWISSKGANLVLAGGMGHRAQSLFSQFGVEVICGCESKPPEELVQEYLDGKLVPGQNLCDH